MNARLDPPLPGPAAVGGSIPPTAPLAVVN